MTKEQKFLIIFISLSIYSVSLSSLPKYLVMFKLFSIRLFSHIFKEFSNKDNNDIYKVNKCLNILGFNEQILDETKTYILDEITKYIFNTS